MKKMRKRQLRYVGYEVRGQSLEKQCQLEMIEGSRARERQRIKYLDRIKTLVGVETLEKSSTWQIIEMDGAILSSTSTSTRHIGKVR